MKTSYELLSVVLGGKSSPLNNKAYLFRVSELNGRRFSLVIFSFVVLAFSLLIGDVISLIDSYSIRKLVQLILEFIIFSVLTGAFYAWQKKYRYKGSESNEFARILHVCIITLSVWAGSSVGLHLEHMAGSIMLFIVVISYSVVFVTRALVFLIASIVLVGSTMLFSFLFTMHTVFIESYTVILLLISFLVNRMYNYHLLELHQNEARLMSVNESIRRELKEKDKKERELKQQIVFQKKSLVEKEKDADLIQKKSALLFDNINEYSCTLKVDGANMEILSCNQKFKERFMSVSGVNTIHPELLTYIKQCIVDTKSLSESHKLNLTIENSFLEASWFSLGNDRIVLLINDLSDKIREEEALHRSMERYRGVVESTVAGISIADTDENIIFANQAFANTLEYTQQELFGKSLALLCHKDTFKEFKKLTQQRKKGQKSNYETILKTKTGKNVYLMVSASPIRNHDGSYGGTLAVTVDISEVKRKEKELIETKEKAQEADRLKSSFLANMSHEIRTPMNAIVGFSELLTRPKIAEAKKQKYLDLIRKSGKNLVSLIDDIIDLAKIEAQQLKIAKTNVNLNKVFKHVYDSFVPKLGIDKDEPIELSYQINNENQTYLLLTDENRLIQILNNLVGNAVKYTTQGEVEFGFEVSEKEVDIWVRDTGIGIADDKKNLIFEQFRQGDESFARKYGGTGLGLAISKLLVELLGGQIWFESVLHKGTCFHFTLPYQKSEMAIVERTDDGDTQVYNFDGETILVAEDDDVNFLYIEEVLDDCNVNILRATDGFQILDVLNNHPNINLILMDIQMPGMNGYEAAKMIKKDEKDVHIIAQTAYAMAEDKQKAFDSGCDAYISKPINPLTLVQTINQFLS